MMAWPGSTNSNAALASARFSGTFCVIRYAVLASTRLVATAVAAAVLFALQGGQAVAVVEDPMGDENDAMLDLARSLDLDLVVARWGETGAVSSPEDHREQLRAAFATPGVHMVDVPVDFGPTTAELIAAAGPLAAWQ